MRLARHLTSTKFAQAVHVSANPTITQTSMENVYRVSYFFAEKINQLIFAPFEEIV